MGNKYSAFIPVAFRPILGVKVPVFKNANVGLKQMQPLFFSHGLAHDRMQYSSLYMELASCGYCVVALTHGDGSADYHPQAGTFEEDCDINDYWGRNLAVRHREKEVNALVKEFTNPLTLKNLGPDWK
jgi:hypothetical protein